MLFVEGALEHPLDHRLLGQRLLEIVELRAAGRRDSDSDAEILAAAAFAQFDARRIKRRVELLGNVRDGAHEAILIQADHLDRESAWILDQRLTSFLGKRDALLLGGRRLGGHNLGTAFVVTWRSLSHDVDVVQGWIVDRSAGKREARVGT